MGCDAFKKSRDFADGGDAQDEIERLAKARSRVGVPLPIVGGALMYMAGDRCSTTDEKSLSFACTQRPRIPTRTRYLDDIREHWGDCTPTHEYKNR